MRNSNRREHLVLLFYYPDWAIWVILRESSISYNRLDKCSFYETLINTGEGRHGLNLQYLEKEAYPTKL
jgi:hypothetical protein